MKSLVGSMLVIPDLNPSNSRGLEFGRRRSLRRGLDAPERVRQLNGVAIKQMKSLFSAPAKRAIGKVMGKMQ